MFYFYALIIYALFTVTVMLMDLIFMVSKIIQRYICNHPINLFKAAFIQFKAFLEERRNCHNVDLEM